MIRAPAAYPVAVMIQILGWVARLRVALLTMALLTAVALQVLLRNTGSDFGLRLAAGIVPPVAFILCSAVAARFFHPAKLVARPEVPAFDVPANPTVVLASIGYTFFAVLMVSGLVRDIAADEELWWLAAILAILVAGQLAAFWSSALGRFGARLSPDGIEFRELFGSRFTPWDALATPLAAYPHDAQQVTLHLAHPELVRRRGLRHTSPTSLPAAGVNAEFLARAVHEYANRADLRPAIGSTAELDRFLAIPQIDDVATRAPH